MRPGSVQVQKQEDQARKLHEARGLGSGSRSFDHLGRGDGLTDVAHGVVGHVD